MSSPTGPTALNARLNALVSQGCFHEEPCHWPTKIVTVSPTAISQDACRSSITDITDTQAVRNLPGTHANTTSPDYTSRLICLSQKNSWVPLNITAKTLCSLMLEHDVSENFLDIVSSFYARAANVEEGLCVPYQVYETSEYLEYMYVYKYAEATDRKEDPYVIRQTALYHQIRVRDDRSTYILISPRTETLAQTAAIDWLESVTSVSECRSQAFKMNSLVLKSYIDGFRHYMTHFERKVEEISLVVQGQGFEDPDGKNKHYMTTLNWIEARLLPMDSMIAGLERTSERLRSTIMNWHNEHEGSAIQPTNKLFELLSNTMHRASAYKENLHVLLHKCERAAKLLDGILSFNNQEIARQQSEHVLYLTNNTVDDSATVKVITTITLIFLSFTAVAAVMAMPLFYLDLEDGAKLLASPSIWIYFAIAVPLTVISIVAWRMLLVAKRRQRAQFLAHKKKEYEV